ncbi:hypothetical protein [Longitalea luteola]|uniref:hypothetical protein n=1 Tax=Longitalea luteola TaxID=2812563 RepID=UPI001A970BF5|nr:hypothetical protein [Longitalea luteola]
MSTTKPINLQLSIEVNNDDVIANVNFLNNSSTILYLDYWTIGLNKTLTNSIFSIRDENNKHVLYSGAMAYRKIVPEDFIPLNPGESINTRIIVNRDYEIIKGHTYKVFFCAYNPTFPDKQPRLELQSNIVEFVYK